IDGAPEEITEEEEIEEDIDDEVPSSNVSGSSTFVASDEAKKVDDDNPPPPVGDRIAVRIGPRGEPGESVPAPAASLLEEFVRPPTAVRGEPGGEADDVPEERIDIPEADPTVLISGTIAAKDSRPPIEPCRYTK